MHFWNSKALSGGLDHSCALGSVCMVLAFATFLFTPGAGLIQSLIRLTMPWLIWLTLTAAMRKARSC
jgi:hypothetical protein